MSLSQGGFQLGILPERKIDRRALATSYTFVVVATLIYINIGILFPDRIPLKQYRVISLIPMPALRPEPEPVKVKPVIKAKLLTPAPVFENPKLVVPREVRAPRPEAAEAPKVVVNQFAPPQLKPAAGGPRPRLLEVGDFSGSSAAPTVNAPPQKVQTGGFGDPNGLKGTGKEGAKLYAAPAGSFDMPVGPGQGNGSGGAKGIQGTVASADFGTGVATPSKGDGRGHGSVQTSGFGAQEVAQNTPHIQRVDSLPTTPVEITYKPNPIYTDEARSLRLEGEVLLEVEFAANGQLHQHDRRGTG